MNTSSIYYYKARGIPLYYRIDPEARSIESLKNWPGNQKGIDLLPFEESFASDLQEAYDAISPQQYHSVRAYVLQLLVHSTGLPPQKKGCIQDTTP